MKRMSAPKSWNIKRKSNVFISKPNAGAHSLHHCLSIGTLLREYLKVASTLNEVKKILNNGLVFVDGRVRQNPKYPVGLMDVIELKKMNKAYRMLLDKNGKLVCVQESKEKSGLKPLRVMSKKNLGDTIQINLFAGRNIITEKTDVKTGDTIILTMPEQKENGVIRFEKNNMVYLIGGNHIGRVGTIAQIKGSKVIIKLSTGEVFETLKKFAYPIGSQEPVISIAAE